jgi:single-stranded-DNA-specific exonuclease
MAELLMRSGLTQAEKAGTFLNPTLGGLSDPFEVPRLSDAAERLVEAIDKKQKVIVLGDYDVDGVTSTALLVTVLRNFGLSPSFVVPRRAEDGYGLSRSAIDRALEIGKPDLFVALDCGTNSHDEVSYLCNLGMDVIVVDHHRSKEKPLAQGILINPHIHEETTSNDSAWRYLCTAGLVFKLMHGLLKHLRERKNPIALTYKLRDQLDLVAMGTVADLVPLTGENRIMASNGLRILAQTQRPGLRALMEVAGLKPGQEIMPMDISYRLGPRINASGRLADAALSVELMVSEDTRFCYETAHQLDTFNRERQDIERQMTEQAEKIIENHFIENHGIVLFEEGWHPGVVGIVAGRVTRKYNRPCVVLGSEGELAKGSGRSIEGVNLVDVLGKCSAHLESWGGHPMAVGVSLKKTNVQAFRKLFTEAVKASSGSDLAEQRIDISAWISVNQIKESLMQELETLHPFGQGNPEPVFGIKGIVLKQKPDVFKEVHFRFSLPDATGKKIQGVAWKMANKLPPSDDPIDIAVGLHWNHFNGRKSLQLEMLDWRLSD